MNRDPEELLSEVELAVFDFDGVFTDNTVYVMKDGREAVRCSRADGLGLRMLDRCGVKYMVLSAEVNPVVGERCAKLKIECRQAVNDKAAAFQEIISEFDVTASAVCYLGNDINDLGVMELVSVPVAVADAYDAVKETAVIVLSSRGGNGAVRELCEKISRAKDSS